MQYKLKPNISNYLDAFNLSYFKYLQRQVNNCFESILKDIQIFIFDNFLKINREYYLFKFNKLSIFFMKCTYNPLYLIGCLHRR